MNFIKIEDETTEAEIEDPVEEVVTKVALTAVNQDILPEIAEQRRDQDQDHMSKFPI